MPLIKVLDMIGKTPVRVDLRTRTADGTLRYPLTQTEESPRVCDLLKVEIREKKNHRTGAAEKWLYWFNSPVVIPGMQDCGYSGQMMDGEAEHAIYLRTL
jgi:hypothetical protein